METEIHFYPEERIGKLPKRWYLSTGLRSVASHRTIILYSLYLIILCLILNGFRSCKQNQLGAQISLICLLLLSTCFGQLCVHHQEKIPYLCDTWYLSLYTDDCLACGVEFIPPCISDITVFSPDDGQIVVRNMQRKTINMLRKFVHQVGSIYKIIQRCTVNKTYTRTLICAVMPYLFSTATGSGRLNAKDK